LFGIEYYDRRFRYSKSRTHKYTPAELLKKSSFYRKKVLGFLDTLTCIDKAEYIRKLVSSSLESIYKVQTVSDKDFVSFLIEKAREDIEEYDLTQRNKEE